MEFTDEELINNFKEKLTYCLCCKDKTKNIIEANLVEDEIKVIILDTKRGPRTQIKSKCFICYKKKSCLVSRKKILIEEINGI